MARKVDRLYAILPPSLQNLGLSLYGLAYRHERLGGAFDDYVKDFVARDALSQQAMLDYLETKLRTVLTRAYQDVPYYRREWRSIGVEPGDLSRARLTELELLPVTTKQALRDDPLSFVATSVAARTRLHRYYSSGSTGTPITVLCSNEGHRRFIAAREARSFLWAETSIHRPRSTIGGRLVVPKAEDGPPFHRYNAVERQVYFSAYHISPTNVPAYVSAFNRHRPRLLTGYAYSHFLLARMMLDQGLALEYDPDAVVLSSEKLAPEMKRVIEKAFRARAFEEYGSVENCLLATECQQGSLHINPDFGIVEIVNDENRPVPAGTEGRILATGLLNEAQPLIRYEIGDIGAWSAASCSCGRDHLPVLAEVVGRLEDVVTGPDGRQLVRFHSLFLGLPHVVEGQVIQEGLSQFRVRVVAADGFGEGDVRAIRGRFQERLGRVQVQVERVSSIARTERGKFRAVVSQLPGPKHTTDRPQ
jgi:phenylacetate-CoA ligase